MLLMEPYSREYIDRCRAKLEADLRGCRAQFGDSPVAGFEPRFFMRAAISLAAALLLTAGCASRSAPPSGVVPAAGRPPLIVSAGSGALDTGEGRVRILAEGAATGQLWAALERTEPPGTRTGLHRHNRMDEAFYVVRGTLTVYVEGRLHSLPAGSFVLIPRGSAHAQGNLTADTLKMVSFFVPAGWEQSARARAELHRRFPAGSEEFARRIGPLLGGFDLEPLGPSPLPPPDRH